MSDQKMMRLSQVARKLNVGRDTIIDFLSENGFEVDRNPNSKISTDQVELLTREYASSLLDKEEADNLTIGTKHTEDVIIKSRSDAPSRKDQPDDEIRIKNISIDTPEVQEETAPEPAKPAVAEKKDEPSESEKPKLQGIKVVGKIDLEPKKKSKKEEAVTPEPAKEEAPAAETKVEEPKAKVEEPVKEETKKEPVAEAPKEEAPIETPKPTETPAEAPAAEAVEKATPETTEPPTESKVEDKVVATPAAGTGPIKAKADKLAGLKVIGKIELPAKKEKKKPEPVASSDKRKDNKKRPRKRIQNAPTTSAPGRPFQKGRKAIIKAEPTDKEIQDQIKATLAKLSGGTKKGGGAKYRKEKRSAVADKLEEHKIKEDEESKTLQVTEFIAANDLASLMDVSVNDVIGACMTLGMFVSINQRLDAESITVIADEFGFTVSFTTAEDELQIVEEEDTEESLSPRAPIVTIMGHVDHGKTSLLDYIRKSKVTEGEAGGITQHIGAYDVMTDTGQKIAFLDTPGHEAFTAMRARGAKVTDIVIIVVAADDSVMPQTKEAINHAQVAGVPIVIAINKIDRPNANADKIREALSVMNILVEDWGGKYQCQEISAKTGQGIDELLEKVLLEAELLELKANHSKLATGTVIEATLDKGRGYLTTILVQAGTLKIGDILLAGSFFGRVKAMFDHKGQKLKEAGPATPVQMLGLSGAPQAGDLFNILGSEREAREISTKREQINREQSVRTKKHITLDEIGRRMAIGSFKELNVIIKGDVDGSVEALSDSLLKLSTEEVQVNILQKGVGQISESDVLLATASDAVIIGFQVRPSGGAKKIAETEEIEIRLYSIIYDAINDVRDAMEGMLSPAVEEVIVGNIEIRDVFKITKVGTVAGCMVIDGAVKRSNKIRVIRDGIVVYSGEIGQLKRFKDDVQEVRSGFECGLSIKNFNDLNIGDVIEGFEEREVKRKL